MKQGEKTKSERVMVSIRIRPPNENENKINIPNPIESIDTQNNVIECNSILYLNLPLSSFNVI